MTPQQVFTIVSLLSQTESENSLIECSGLDITTNQGVIYRDLIFLALKDDSIEVTQIGQDPFLIEYNDISIIG